MLAQRLAFALVGVAGARILPGETRVWQPPVEASTWSTLTRMWREQLGPFDDMAIHLRRPARREGLSLLLMADGRPLAFVKVRSEHTERLDAEQAALDCLHGRVRHVVLPTVRAAGVVDAWHYLALSPLPAKLHRLATAPPVVDIVDEYSHALAAARPRPPRAKPDWLPMHGDLTPWNLRAMGNRRLVLFDWEDTDWAPRRADLLWYDAAIARRQLRTRPSGVTHSDEVIQFWIDRLSRRAGPQDRNLAGRVLGQLRNGWRP